MAHIVPSFYRSVMRLRSQKKIPTPTKKADPLNVGKDLEVKDLLKTFLDSDMGDSENKKHDFFQKHLKELDQDQLDQMMQKIDRMGQELIGTDVEDQFGNLKEFVFETVDSALKTSSEKTNDLREKIERRLEKFSLLTLRKDAKNRKKIRLKGKNISLDVFVRTFFFDLATEYRELVESGVIVPSHEEPYGLQFVSHKIERILLG